MRTPLLAVIGLLTAVLLLAASDSHPGADASPQVGSVTSGFGVASVDGQPLYIHVSVFVAPGENGQAVLARELAARGAQPISRQAFALSGFRMDDSNSDANLNNDTSGVVMHYNQAGETLGAGEDTDDEDAIEAAMASWSSLATVAFDFAASVTATGDAPSLARETPGPSFFSAQNEIGWDRIGGSTLAVTYSAISSITGPESDIVINTRVPWGGGEGEFDLETVVRHELGHVLGLTHTPVDPALMETAYDGIEFIELDDELGAAALYPVAVQLGSIAGTVTELGGGPIEGATVSLHISASEPASVSVLTNASGDYVIPNIIPGASYVVTATAKHFSTDTADPVNVTANTLTDNVDLTLESSRGGGAGGGGPCNGVNDPPICP